jgi:hypothetical protein
MVAYLANPEAGFVTGASLTIDGHTLPERSRSTEVPRAVAAAVRAAVTAMGGGWQSPFRQLKAFTPKEAHAVFYARPHKSIL